jgi:hypothetical protein
MTASYRAWASAAALAMMSAACGGGGSGGGSSGAELSSQSPAGAYSGSITRRPPPGALPIVTSSDVQVMVLDDQSFWAVFSLPGGSEVYPTGFITGHAATGNGSFRSTDATDFSYATPAVGTFSATYRTDGSFRGGGADSAGTVEFDATATPTSRYRFSGPPSLADIQGAWAVRTPLFSPATLTISASGVINADWEGCALTGTLTPDPAGRNLYVSVLNFGDSPCRVPGQTSTGVAYTNIDPDGRRRLVIVGVIPSRTYGLSLIGVR